MRIPPGPSPLERRWRRTRPVSGRGESLVSRAALERNVLRLHLRTIRGGPGASMPRRTLRARLSPSALHQIFHQGRGLAISSPSALPLRSNRRASRARRPNRAWRRGACASVRSRANRRRTRTGAPSRDRRPPRGETGARPQTRHGREPNAASARGGAHVIAPRAVLVGTTVRDALNTARSSERAN